MMIAWLKKLITVVRNYDHDLKVANDRITELEKLIRLRTDIAVNAGYDGRNYIVAVGRYRNHDYVEIFQTHAKELEGLIDHLRAQAKHGIVRTVDAPPPMRAAFDRRNISW